MNDTKSSLTFIPMSMRWICNAHTFETRLEEYKDKEDDLRELYIALETYRASLWMPNNLSAKRYDIDAVVVARLVQVKTALASHWLRSGQIHKVDLNIDADVS